MYHWNIFNGLIFISALLIQTADAAEIQILSPPGFDVTVVTLKGKIIPGDAERFVSAVENLGKVVVAASGPGGSVNEALEIGATIRQRNFATQVLPDMECYSACALVWISGARRYMSNSSTIGFHAAWTLHNGEMREAGMGNAEIGSFLTHLGLRVEAIRFITQAPPDKVALLTTQIARTLGIDIFEHQSGFDVITPVQKPTADVLAHRAVLLTSVAARCSSLFALSEQKLKEDRLAAIREGHNLAGSEVFTNVLLYQLDLTKVEFAKTGPVDWCFLAVKQLSQQNIKIVPEGPSFDCRKVTKPSERIICTDPDLSIRDRATAALFQAGTALSSNEDLRHAMSMQRKWLATRDACSDDAACLLSAYKMRLQQLVH